jgi:hypothetical protein
MLARYLPIRAALVERCRRQEGDGDESYPWGAWRGQLDQLTVESLGVVPNPRGRRDGDKNWTPYYIPDKALRAVSAFVALVLAIIRTLGYSGWRKWNARIRGWATEARAQLRARRMPQTMPPQTPRETKGSDISSTPGASQGNYTDVLRRIAEKNPALRADGDQEGEA